MIGTKALTMAIAAVVLIGSMAAVGAAAPADQAPDTASDAYAENAPEDAAGDGDDANASADRVGPTGGLPDQVPDHVSGIHETVQSHLDGSVESLGQVLSDLLGGDVGASATAEA